MSGSVQILIGNCVEEMAKMPADSVDAIVCDPPAGINFMNQKFDSDRGGRDQWIAWLREVMAEVLRVSKPGAHGFVWALPRTSHWTMMALEDAGWEIREVCHHIFGSGFPKSRSMRDIGRPELGTALKPAVENWLLVRKPLSETSVARNVLKHGTGAINIDGCRVEGMPHSGGARMASSGKTLNQYNEYQPGPNKPGNTSGRWPPNLLLSHVGGPNGCKPTGEVRRVKGAGWRDKDVKPEGEHIAIGKWEHGFAGKHYADPDGTEPQEVWICHESCPILEMDRQSGESKSGNFLKKDGTRSQRVGNEGWDRPWKHEEQRKEALQPYNDKGGASRYFPRFEPELEAPFKYQAKASRAERNKGLEGMPEQETTALYENGHGLSGRTQMNGEWVNTENPRKPKTNPHPTVKPIALMRWLVRLVCPPNGTVLDPFAGSGSTGCAAVLEGFNFIGIEQDSDYALIAEKRISYWSTPEHLRPQTKPQANPIQGYRFGEAGARKVPRCPQHDETFLSGETAYKCGCKFEWTNEPKAPDPTDPTFTGRLF